MSFGACKGVRLRLTDACNYRCFFCHEEGGHAENNYSPDMGEMVDLIRTLYKEEGRKDFTLTGGEPVLNKSILLGLLDFFATPEMADAKVTLVTNGEFLDAHVLAGLAKCPSRKLHVSVHTTNREQYQQITGQTRVSPDDLLHKLEDASCRGIELKLNAVLLRGINDQPDDIEKLMEYTRRAKANYLKIIEFLVTKDSYYNLYVNNKGLVEKLKLKYGDPVSSNLRTTAFLDKGRNIFLEMTRCSCGVGCSHCEAVHDDTFTGARYYHPCMLMSERYEVPGHPVASTLQKGTAYVASMAQKYHDNSPALIRKTHNVSGFSGALFRINNEIFEYLSKKAEQISIKKFHDVYYRAGGSKPNDYLIKLRHSEHEAGRCRLILYKECFEHSAGWDWYSVEFLDPTQDVFFGPSHVGAKLLEVLGCEECATYYHERRVFRTDGLAFSLEKIDGIGCFVYFLRKEIRLKEEKIKKFLNSIDATPVTSAFLHP